MPGSNAHTEGWVCGYISCCSGLILSSCVSKLENVQDPYIFINPFFFFFKLEAHHCNVLVVIINYVAVPGNSPELSDYLMDCFGHASVNPAFNGTSLRSSYFSINVSGRYAKVNTKPIYGFYSGFRSPQVIFVRPSRTYLPLRFMLKWLGGRLDKFSYNRNSYEVNTPVLLVLDYPVTSDCL